MDIRVMRIGGLYVIHGRLVSCCSISEELAGGTLPMAAYRDHNDAFLWAPCRDYRAATRADLADDIRARYCS